MCNEFGSVISRLPGTAPEEIAEGLRHLATSPPGLSEVAARQQAWVAAHSWLALGRRLEGLLRGEMADFVSPIGQGGEKREIFLRPLSARNEQGRNSSGALTVRTPTGISPFLLVALCAPKTLLEN